MTRSGVWNLLFEKYDEDAWGLGSDNIIDDIQRHEDENGFVVLGDRAGLKKGDKVRITDGAMADQIGIFDAPSDQHRVYLLLELLGREVRVRLPLTALAPAG